MEYLKKQENEVIYKTGEDGVVNCFKANFGDTYTQIKKYENLDLDDLYGALFKVCNIPFAKIKTSLVYGQVRDEEDFYVDDVGVEIDETNITLSLELKIRSVKDNQAYEMLFKEIDIKDVSMNSYSRPHEGTEKYYVSSLNRYLKVFKIMEGKKEIVFVRERIQEERLMDSSTHRIFFRFIKQD
ncbi:hypothetical protein HZI73_26250 (plasmid) [Vallitalea pronyensis]|uniref:Uncharacterized protein n=1 Tax=Vallitalea pronyensis TaxID=1348613 RepID=A0A8J8SJW5_9FIRM|nr:hypothetical protein [Vallitalea pronyensis]QUI25917.1 hypothetical protein HZI73_26250 [Vallitalea pronyensis]